jgi:hypothetical protein
MTKLNVLVVTAFLTRTTLKLFIPRTSEVSNVAVDPRAVLSPHGASFVILMKSFFTVHISFICAIGTIDF